MGKYDEARQERDFRMNPPSSAPGQGSNDGWGDLFPEGSSSVEDTSASLSGNTNNGGINVNNILNGTANQNGQPQNPADMAKMYTAQEDQWIEIIKKVAIGCWKILKAVYGFLFKMVESFRNNTSTDWHMLGQRICLVSAGVFAVGFIFLILSPLIPSINHPSDVMVGAAISAIVGVCLLMFCNIREEDLQQVEVQEPEEDLFAESETETTNADDFIWNESEIEEESYEEEDFGWDDIDGDDLFVDDTPGSCAGTDGFDVDSAISNVREIPVGTHTRQYLYETFTAILPTITPRFSSMDTLSEGSDEFMEFEDYLRGAAYQVGTKEENIPELLEVRKNIFIVQLRASRPAGLKEQEIADAIADLYSRDEDGQQVKFGVYAKVDSMVGVFVINIFTGKSAMVSLADVYRQISSYVLEPKNVMPFVWGINELGKPLYCDLINCDSIIISGEARSGKSWKGQSIVAQLCMYNSPKEIEFYIFDHKDTASDYRYLSTVLPHVRYFCGDANKINPGIGLVLDKAFKERGTLLADSGCINIKDYNKLNPDKKLPYMYILIDELMSLMDGFDKDQQAEFRKHLSTMVSKLPYLGIRLILFPHRIVDSVIGKNTYSLVSSRAVVRQLNEDEVKNAVGVTKKQFPYNLVNNGDMAIKTKDIANGQTVFCHAEVLTTSNEGNKDVFKYIGSVWRKLVPDMECITIEGSIGGYLGTGSEERAKARRTREAVDHTSGQSEYQYEGYSSIEGNIGDLPDVENASEEEFWDEILKGE